MACTISVYPGKSLSETVATDKAKEKEGSGMVFDQLMVRHWDTWNCYEKRNHVFVCELSITSDGLLELPVGNPDKQLVDLMAGLHFRLPKQALWRSRRLLCPS